MAELEDYPSIRGFEKVAPQDVPGLATAAGRIGELPDASQRIERELDHLAATIDRLEGTIGLALKPEREEPATIAKDDTEGSPFTYEIRGHARRVNVLSHRLSSLLDRLDF